MPTARAAVGSSTAAAPSGHLTEIAHFATGEWVAGGRGSEYLYVNLSVYLITPEAVWRWHGSGWELIGRDIAGIVAVSLGGGGA